MSKNPDSEHEHKSPEILLPGECTRCGTPVTKILNCSTGTLYTNGDNYIYTGKPRLARLDFPGSDPDDLHAYSIFSCENCGAVISDAWRRLK
jgi:hypothetical protein